MPLTIFFHRCREREKMTYLEGFCLRGQILSSLALCLFEVPDISGCPLMKWLLWIRAVKSNLALIHLRVICVAEMAHKKIPQIHYSLPGLFFVQSKQREFIKICIKFMGTHRIDKKLSCLPAHNRIHFRKFNFAKILLDIY